MSNLMAKLYGETHTVGPARTRYPLLVPQQLEAEEHQYAPREVLALEPRAFGMFFDVEHPGEPEMSDDGVVVIDVRGPLMHHRSFWCDSYDAIKARVAAAIALNPRFIILNIDSPGGLVSGAFDTARSIRQMVTDAPGVELYSHVTGVGASAAYALATAASWIGVSETAMVGSVGVVDALIDATEQNAMFGINVKLVASGQRKTDGNPDEPMTEGAINATQARVDELAEMFFALVTEHGFGQGTDALRALQAGVFTGKQAVELGLASEVITFEETLAFAKPGAQNMPTDSEAAKKGPGYKMSKVSDAIESLREAAEGEEDDEEAEKARKMLKALDDEEPDAQDDEEEEDDEPDAQDDDEPEAQEEDDEPSAQDDDKDEDDEKDAKALALRALAEVHNMKATAKKKAKQAKRDKERAELIASRNDLSDEMVALLEDKATSLATVRKMVKTLARGKPRRRKASDAAAAARATGTRGIGSGNDRSPRSTPEEKEALDVVFGLNQLKSGIKHEPYAMIFGASVAQKEGN